MNLVQIMNLYLVAARCVYVPPFRCLKPVHVKKFDKGGEQFFDMRKCMSIIEEIARRNGVWRSANAGMDIGMDVLYRHFGMGFVMKYYHTWSQRLYLKMERFLCTRAEASLSSGELHIESLLLLDLVGSNCVVDNVSNKSKKYYNLAWTAPD